MSLYQNASGPRMGYDLTIPLKGATLEITGNSVKELEDQVKKFNAAHARIEKVVGGLKGGSSRSTGRTASRATTARKTGTKAASRKKATKASARKAGSRSTSTKRPTRKSSDPTARRAGAKSSSGKPTKQRTSKSRTKA